MKRQLLSILVMLSVGLSVNASYPQPSTSTAAASVETKLTAPAGQRNDEFGRAVAVQGDIAVVGAPNAAVGGVSTGAAYVFKKTTSGWQFDQQLPANPSAASFFGASVAIDGDRIVVGAPGDENVAVGAGAAYVYVHAPGKWAPEGKLIGSENSAFDSFGISVAIKGETIVCGAFGNSDPGLSEVGSAYVFRRIAGLWTEQQELTASDRAPSARFGLSVAMNEDTVAVGADGDSELGFFSGAAYVFNFDGSSWIQQQKLHAHDAQASASFGYHLAMSGDTLVVGAPQNQVGNHTLGAAYVFTRGSQGWLQDRKLVAKDSDTFDGFGLRVGIDGDTIAVGSVFDHDAAVSGGAAYVYKRNGQSGWSLQEKLFASDAAKDDAFGCAVAVSNNTVLVGAFGRSDVAFNAGAAYIYDF